MANNTLDRLLEVEAKAGAMVKDAQEEAQRRINECEEKNRIAFDECYKEQLQAHQKRIIKIREDVKQKYQNTIDEYRSEISSVKADTEKFNALLNSYLFNEG